MYPATTGRTVASVQLCCVFHCLKQLLGYYFPLISIGSPLLRGVTVLCWMTWQLADTEPSEIDGKWPIMLYPEEHLADVCAGNISNLFIGNTEWPVQPMNVCAVLVHGQSVLCISISIAVCLHVLLGTMHVCMPILSVLGATWRPRQ